MRSSCEALPSGQVHHSATALSLPLSISYHYQMYQSVIIPIASPSVLRTELGRCGPRATH